MQAHDDDNLARLNSFAKKDLDGKFLSKGGVIVFGENSEVAAEKYLELLNKEIEFEPYTVEMCEDTKRLPADAQSELLDIIIVEKK
jgi:hypothetical protein